MHLEEEVVLPQGPTAEPAHRAAHPAELHHQGAPGVPHPRGGRRHLAVSVEVQAGEGAVHLAEERGEVHPSTYHETAVDVYGGLEVAPTGWEL